jgi:hypothetical protein
MTQLKPDAAEFGRIIAEQKDKLPSYYSWWPQYLCHVTDINNAIKILEAGQLLSRNEAKKRDFLQQDSANQEIIRRTNQQGYDNFVRLYFRPRTPFLYNTEGFQPNQTEAHCPVPVYFMFDAEKVLTLKDCKFTYRTLARDHSNFYSTAQEFAKAPFELIYHEGVIPPEKRDEIIACRHAEVIIPRSLDLTFLRAVVCRSPAELSTLKYLLSARILHQWQQRIVVSENNFVFFRHRFHVKQVILGHSSVFIEFNWPERNENAGSYRVKIVVDDTFNSNQLQASWDINTTLGGTRSPYEVDISKLSLPRDYTASIFINGMLAYKSRYLEEIPF